MRFNFASKSLRYTLRALLFVGAVVLVYECIPHQIKFDKQFMLGKPWPNELLTAEFDFPIYKDESELKHEQDSILRYLVPYFTINREPFCIIAKRLFAFILTTYRHRKLSKKN